jgi:hypothetical protein
MRKLNYLGFGFELRILVVVSYVLILQSRRTAVRAMQFWGASGGTPLAAI